MKSMGTSENKELSQESTSEQARSKLSGKGLALAALIGVIAIALTALAVINNPGLSIIADNPNPMASGEPEEVWEVVYPGEIHNDGEQGVAYYAAEGGTLTYDPNDDGSVVDGPGSINLFASSGVQTGLKEYKRNVAVTPYAKYGSITAVADPGYYFAGWSNGGNSSKLYITGMSGGTATAYFEEIEIDYPEKGEVIFWDEPCVGSDTVAFYATEGGTLTHDPNDDPNAPVKGETVFLDESGNKIDPPHGYSNQASISPNAKTGLKEYVTTIAVTPYAHDGSITAVPDPGYSFVGWDNGKNTNPKWYIQGACGRYTMTAYFEKTTPDVNSGSDAVKYDASDSAAVAPPTMNVYAQNALDGNVALAQGKSVSLNGFAVPSAIDYAGKFTGKVKYATSNAGIATVSDSGKVTASKKKTGTAKITLSSVENPNCKKVVTVKVVKKSKYKAVKAINKVNLKKQYKANVAKQIAVKVTSWNPKAPSNKDYVVTVSPASKASVDPATNKITFKAKGTVKVTVKSAENPKVKKTVNVKVK